MTLHHVWIFQKQHRFIEHLLLHYKVRNGNCLHPKEMRVIWLCPIHIRDFSLMMTNGSNSFHKEFIKSPIVVIIIDIHSYKNIFYVHPLLLMRFSLNLILSVFFPNVCEWTNSIRYVDVLYECLDRYYRLRIFSQHYLFDCFRTHWKRNIELDYFSSFPNIVRNRTMDTNVEVIYVNFDVECIIW